MKKTDRDGSVLVRGTADHTLSIRTGNRFHRDDDFAYWHVPRPEAYDKLLIKKVWENAFSPPLQTLSFSNDFSVLKKTQIRKEALNFDRVSSIKSSYC